MVAKNGYTSKFTNRYGEEWLFEYDGTKAEGILSGSDVDWKAFRVVDGRAIGLILNEEELTWLRACWCCVEATRPT